MNKLVCAVPGTRTLPEKRPLVSVKVMLSLLLKLPSMILLPWLKVTRFVKGALRLPLSKVTMPLVRSITRLLVGCV